ncbi:cytosolic leucyl tRNA synthetase [Tulasnella sp. 403]|nr:cytosolic leucyl tRNA synthetase [Tulasnella sp. 403]
MTTAQDATIELVKTNKRDFLVGLEKKYQQRWEDEKLFEVDAPPPSEHEQHPKWFGTFPYPYMNGSLHLGHGLTISKIEFNAGYQRLLGKRTLLPAGMHCSGMPIKAAADKLAREIEIFGPDFEGYSDDANMDALVMVPDQANTSAPVDMAKKGANTTGLTYQFQIMESTDIPCTEIKKFANPSYWLQYFPTVTKEDYIALGLRVDWRRSFITTDANPYYDSFIRWQMNKLYKLGKIKYGKFCTIYSPKDGQPCLAHDRYHGEALNVRGYIGIKMKVLKWSEDAETELKGKPNGKNVYLVAATAHPETIHGQRNCFVGTSIKYGLFHINDNDVYVCTYRAMRNMVYQGLTHPEGQVNQITEIDGSKLVGTKITMPFASDPEVYVLPMENVLATKGTGIVTSVPSDSPDDCATLLDPKKPESSKIKPEWATKEPVQMLTTPTYGDLTAPTFVEQLKIDSQKGAKPLAEAKEIAYKPGFYNGKTLVGEFKGMEVSDAESRVREWMIEAGEAFLYYEPEGLVVSRSGDECVVALVDEWYLDYEDEAWKAQARKLLSQMETYFPETRHAFEVALDRLGKWACARIYGLGSKVPWDPKFLVESLSDSTVYMSYYTISHLLQGGTFDGSKPGPLGITADQMTNEVWEFVLGSATEYPDTTTPHEKLDALKNEFSYFYPLDIRSSGKDLIANHLTFAIYNHAALFPERYWPRSMRANGHLMVNGKKMGKSTGNSLTLRQCLQRFGADATRLALADAGDGIEDTNFEEKTANAAVLRLHTLIDWCKEMLEDESRANLRPADSPKDSYHDCVFENEINELINITKTNYEATLYKEALRTGFYELQSSRDWYHEVTSDIGMHAGLITYWIRTTALLVSPIAPHFAEHLWTELLKEPQSIQLARWPTPSTPVERSVLDAAKYMRSTLESIRDAEASMVKWGRKEIKTKGIVSNLPKRKAVRIFVASKLKEEITKRGSIEDEKAMPFIMDVKKCTGEFGTATALNRTLLFSEREALEIILPYLKRHLGFSEGEVMSVEDVTGKEGPGFMDSIIKSAEPGSPAFVFWNTD